MDTYLGYLFSCAVRRKEHWKQTSLACVGSALSVSATLGLPPAHGMCAFPLYTAQATGCSAGNCVKRALGCVHFPGLSRSVQVSGSPPRCTLGWACVLCPSQARTAQETRCLGSALSPGWGGASSHLPHPSCLVSLVRSGRALSGVPCVPRRELISGCNPPGRCQPSRIPEVLFSNWEPAHILVEAAISGAEIAPHRLWLSPACLCASGVGWASPQPASSPPVFAQSFVL